MQGCIQRFCQGGANLFWGVKKGGGGGRGLNYNVRLRNVRGARMTGGGGGGYSPAASRADTATLEQNIPLYCPPNIFIYLLIQRQVNREVQGLVWWLEAWQTEALLLPLLLLFFLLLLTAILLALTIFLWWCVVKNNFSKTTTENVQPLQKLTQ